MTKRVSTRGYPRGLEIQSQRRQNKSCDQCRSGKRRCNVQTFYNNGVFSSTTCSNCTKWKKRCTTHWAQARYLESSPASNRCRTSNASFVSIAGNTSFDLDFGASEFQAHLSPKTLDIPPLSAQSEVGGIEHIDECWHNGNNNGDFGLESADYSLLSHASSLPDCALYGALSGQPRETYQTFAVGESVTSGMESSSANVTAIGTTANEEEADSLMNGLDDQQATVVSAGEPFLTTTLADTHAKGWLRAGLLKIYHDSMEGALGCWLISRNCPYPVAELDTRDAWSPSWSNRVARSVCALDQYSYEEGSLSEHHRKQGSRVLNLVIMAFAAQWAQSGPRTTAPYPNTGQPFQTINNDPFGGDLQERLWGEASQALSTANNNPSFKAIFAGIIFSLTQAPLAAAGGYNTRHSSTEVTLHAILGQDEAAVYLDVALRKLHSHQRKFHDGPTTVLPTKHQTTFRLLLWLAVMFDTLSAAMNKRSVVVNDHDSSIDVDQSSLVEEVPVITSSIDLDGFMIRSEDRTVAPPFRPTIWGDYFMRDSQQRKLTTVRWPCTYSEAAMCLADAAPVKVLLFRRVGHLQDLLYQHTSPSTLEVAVSAALDVYYHWNTKYGLFIKDCIAQHELLPARIQSWYILLAGHWHLAVLLLADLLDKIDVVDDATSDTLRQESIDTVAQLGCVSSHANSSLAGDEYETCSASPSSFSRSPHFHHAVNQAALLTEPWTVVLVRVFGKAAELLIRRIQFQSYRKDGYLRSTWPVDANQVSQDAYIENACLTAGGGVARGDIYYNSDLRHESTDRQKLKWCLEALWLLGRKSDVAVQVVSLLLKLEAATM